ncbi:MAG: aminoacyl-tRNA deacylase [Armatimonadetes bacterium]|nr:aminoacyl-tRNA deacylase [Armatimonadota bacterium]
MKRTRAIQILQERGVAHEVRAFAAEAFTAEEAARALGLPAGSLFKTLVARGERRGVVLALVPADAQLSLRKLAAAAGDRRMEMVGVAELMPLTGYHKGGVSPLGGRRAWPTYVDGSARRWSSISISAGQRGLQILLAPDALAGLCDVTYADLAEAE